MKIYDFVEAITLAEKEDMKKLLKKEEAKERMINCAFELFPKGVSDEEIQKELSVIVPNVSIDHVQRLRRQWGEKKDAADEEMRGGPGGADGGEEKDDVQVGDISSSEQKIKPSVIPKVELEKKVEGKEMILPSQKDFVDYLKPRTMGYDGLLDEAFGKDKWRHWVRYDEGGFRYPSPEDWIELKKALNLDDTFDLSQMEQTGVFDEIELTGEDMEEKIIRKTEEKGTPYEKADEDLERERREIERMKADVRDDKAHAEIVRATDELRRAITSEIHAQEAYENAEKKISRTEESIKGKMDHILSRFDKFEQSVDMLELEERLQGREPVEVPKLKSETVEGKQFEKMVSDRIMNIGLKKIVEDIVDEASQKRDIEEKPPEELKTVKPEIKKEKPEDKKNMFSIEDLPSPRDDRADDIVKDLYKKNLLSIENLAVYLHISVEQARKLDIIMKHVSKKDEDVVHPAEGEKPAEKIEISPNNAITKVAELSGTSADDVRKWIAERHKHPKIEEAEVVNEKLPEKKIEEETIPGKFYNKIKRYLDTHPYLIVKKESGVPEVYYIRMKRNGILIGLGGGVPAGCLLLYIILLLAGVL